MEPFRSTTSKRLQWLRSGIPGHLIIRQSAPRVFFVAALVFDGDGVDEEEKRLDRG